MGKLLDLEHMMRTAKAKPKVYTRDELRRMPTLDPWGNLEFQRVIYAMASGIRLTEFGESSYQRGQ